MLALAALTVFCGSGRSPPRGMVTFNMVYLSAAQPGLRGWKELDSFLRHLTARL